MGMQFQLLPLNILDYYFSKCDITILPLTEANKQYSSSPKFNISSSINILKELEETAQVQVNVTLPNDPPEGEVYNMFFDICIVGLFQNISKDEKLADVLDIVHINAASMLIGAIRGRLADLTAGSPFKKYILPALCISQIKKDIKKTEN